MTRIVNLLLDVNHRFTGENLLKQTTACDTEDNSDRAVNVRIQQRVRNAIAWYGEHQGYALRWRAVETLPNGQQREITRGSWRGTQSVIRSRRRLAAV